MNEFTWEDFNVKEASELKRSDEYYVINDLLDKMDQTGMRVDVLQQMYSYIKAGDDLVTSLERAVNDLDFGSLEDMGYFDHP